MLIKVVLKKRYVRVEKAENGRYTPTVKGTPLVRGTFEPGNYFLRYTLNGRGTFTAMVRDELVIPISTCYDLIDFAKEEIRITRLSESRKDEDDITFDWDELYELIVKRYPQ